MVKGIAAESKIAFNLDNFGDPSAVYKVDNLVANKSFKVEVIIPGIPGGAGINLAANEVALLTISNVSTNVKLILYADNCAFNDELNESKRVPIPFKLLVNLLRKIIIWSNFSLGGHLSSKVLGSIVPFKTS